MSIRSVIVATLVIAGAALAQTPQKLSFEVASVKASPPPDIQKLVAQAQSGGRMPMGAHIQGMRAEYTQMSLTQLIVNAYKVKSYQITGPNWLASQRFDIIAKLAEGSSKDDAPQMLQALLEERFKLSLHRESQERPVLALVLGKGELKLKESTPAKPLDQDAPFKPGEIEMDDGDGPTRMSSSSKGETVIDRGTNGKFNIKVDQATMMMHLEASQMTMAGFADMLTQLSQMGNGEGRRVVDLTGLKGSYDLTFDFSLAELIAMIRAQAAAAGAAEGPPAAASTASDPGGGASLPNSVAALGLKLEQRKVRVEQLVIDHVEKTPSEN